MATTAEGQAWQRFLAPLLPLALGLAGGFAAYRLGMPLPWMLGPMIANTIVAMAGIQLVAPARLRLMFVPVIGVLLGSAIHPGIFSAALRWWPGVLLLAPFLLTTTWASTHIFRRLGGFDRPTAFFSALPGGVNESMILGEAAGGDVRRIALAHATRIMLVVFVIAMFFYLAFGVRGSGGPSSNWVALRDLSLIEYAILGLAGFVGALGAARLGLPAAPIMGPMVLSGLAHGTATIDIAPPTLIVLLAQMVIGVAIGCRFSGAKLAEVGRDLGVSAVSGLVMLSLTVVFSLLLHAVAGINLWAAFLGYSPGGLAEMSLIALALGQGVAYVSVMHIVRIVLVITVARPLFKMQTIRR